MAETLMEALAELAEGQTAEEAKRLQDEALADIQAKATAAVEEAGAIVGESGDPDATHTWDQGNLTKIESGETDIVVPNTIDPTDPNQVAFGIWLESIGKFDIFINKEEGWGGLWNEWNNGSPQTSFTPNPEDSLAVINQMRDSFINVLQASGMSAEMVNELWKWALGKFETDSSFTADRALLEMYERPEFKARFPAIGQMEGAPTPGQYIAFEKEVRKEFKRFGAGYAPANVITSLLLNQVGLTEITERLSEAERILFDVPQEVRDTFNDWWGEENAKEITMSLFLDPTKDWADLENKINTAEVGAWGRMAAGLDAGWDTEMANKVADLGLSQAQLWNSFTNLKDKELLFAENINENTDLRYEAEGVQAEFGIGGNALTLQDLIERRKERRVSRFAGGGTGQAGAMITGSTTGIGAANA